MKIKFSKPLYLGVLALLLFAGCKKTLSPNSVLSTKSNKNTITPVTFDWETGDYMPTPSGTTILRPWASGSNQSFPKIYATDIKKSDGWELVFNTFSTTQFVQPAYFVLYNRYRGVLRAYFYLTPSTPIPSSYVSHTLIQTNSSSPAHVLTYSGSSAADLSVVTNEANLTQAFRTTATGTWYAEEFDMAYDPNVGTKNAATNTMTWQLNSINASALAINGVSQGGINGTVATPKAPGPNIFGSLISGALNFVGFKALSDYVAASTTTAAAKEIANPLKDAAKAGALGAVKNIASGIFGGATNAGDSSKMYVHLTTNATYNMTGSSTDIYLLANPTMPIPGSSGQLSVTGYAPLYTNPLGIMTLSNAPTCSGTQYYDDYGSAHNFEFRLNRNSYTFVWNPSVINTSSTGAQIQNLKQTLISYQNYYDISSCGSSPSWPPRTQSDGGTKFIPDELAPNNYIGMIQDGTCNDSYDMWLRYPVTTGLKLPKNVLRVSFDVVPNNGAPRVTMVKSFNIILDGAINYVLERNQVTLGPPMPSYF
jgi:hypothetical protein